MYMYVHVYVRMHAYIHTYIQIHIYMCAYRSVVACVPGVGPSTRHSRM